MKLPTPQQCLNFFEQYKVPGNIRSHCQIVQRVASFLARQLKNAGIQLNVELVNRGALLHDLFKMVAIDDTKPTKFHSYVFSPEELAMHEKLRAQFPGKYENEVAYEIFRVAYSELALTLLHEGDPHKRDHTLEETLIHYADYRVFQDTIVSLSERFAYLEQRYPASPGFWQEYLRYCLQEEKKIFQHLSFTPQQLKETMDQQKSKQE